MREKLSLLCARRPERISSLSAHDLIEELAGFSDFGRRTSVSALYADNGLDVPVFTNEFWTSRQRAASSLHEVSYRACFKPQLPRFFIDRLSNTGDIIYDPFMGRGTTPIEAALLGRTPYGCDINPLSIILVRPRLMPPTLEEVNRRLLTIDFSRYPECPQDLLTFYHPDTLREICALRQYLLTRKSKGNLDYVDSWIWMVATNRLTGHSPGFFSVYTLPPNQAVSVESQKKINEKRSQVPPRRSVPELILRKSMQLLADVHAPQRKTLWESSKRSVLITGSSERTPEIESDTVSLVVTSPPFLDVVDYAQDNWLRAWFCGIDISEVALWQLRSITEWEAAMSRVFAELRRVLRPDGWIAFEVGEVRGGKVRLEESVVRASLAAGLEPILILINEQAFTKTANCWGITNRKMGTNTNRVVVMKKSA